MTFKPDFGTYTKNNGASESLIIITSNFSPIEITFYPEGLSSITADIDDMMVSFDFYDDILEIFLSIYKNFGLTIQEEQMKKAVQQNNQPVTCYLNQSKNFLIITGVVLTCELTETIVSPTTSESYTPLLIKTAEIVQNPCGILVPNFPNISITPKILGIE